MTSTLPPLTAVRRRLGLELTPQPAHGFRSHTPLEAPPDSRVSASGRRRSLAEVQHDTVDLPESIPDFSRPRHDAAHLYNGDALSDLGGHAVDETFRLDAAYSAADGSTRPAVLPAASSADARRFTNESVEPVSASSTPISLSQATGRLSQVFRSPRQLSKMSAWAATVVFVLAVVISAAIGMVNDRSAAVATGDTSVQDSDATGSPPVETDDTVSADHSAQATASAASGDPEQLYVHVLGQVITPGLVRLEPGSRVVDAIEASGGLLETADAASINLARLLSDGEQVRVLAVGEAPPAGAASAASTTASDGSSAGSSQPQLVNINTAALEELETLPRVGPALAQRIIDWRESEGPFGSIDDLLSVTGIGDKTLDGFRAQITV